MSRLHYEIIKLFLLLVGLLEYEPFATEVSIKTHIKYSCTEMNIGLESLPQQQTNLYLKCLVQSAGSGVHLLVVKESFFSS